MRHLVLFILVTVFLNSFGQSYDPNHLPNTYRSTANPNYWKNKMPYQGYWQQDVSYQMEVVINDSTDVVSCKNYTLNYYNNSPDTLTELYFHLYQNAFQPHSHMHDLYENNEKEVSFGHHEKQGLGTVVKNIQVNGASVDTTLDNTILQVKLNTPLYPNDSVSITLEFDTYFDKGGLRRRMKTFNSSGEKHFDGVHWYPSICVYDAKFKWTTEQHLDKEFYSNFGSFDVKLIFPEKYIVEATGTLQNENEVLPDSIKSAIDLNNYKTTGYKADKSKIYDTTTTRYKTWHYYAENVHNFAFTADPNYRKSTIESNGVKVVTLAQEKNAKYWLPSGEFTKKVIETYSQDFGNYIWPKIIVADAQDGMEYPMLTLDGGKFPGHRGLLAHEVGHMWFYGMVGSNETYRAFMDEGFTQFLTVWSMDKITGEEHPAYPKKPYLNKHRMPNRTKYGRLYYPYMVYSANGYDHPLNTHSSGFRGAVRHGGGYGLVYFKTGVMLYNLRYVLGDDLFQKAMKNYFNTWKCAHPYPEDFRNTIINYTKADLNWFFDQWMETSKEIDYSISSVKKVNSDSISITFERKGDMQMPIDFDVRLKNGDTLHFHVPNTWFQKETDATILKKWYGWGNLHPTYTVTLKVTDKIEAIEIDPSKTLADVNLSNNTYNVSHLKFENWVKNPVNWYNPESFWRPDFMYTKLDGLQAGLHVEGNYMKHFYNYRASILINTRLGQYDIPDSLSKTNNLLSVDLYAKEALSKVKRLFTYQRFKVYGGVWQGQLGFEKIFQAQDLRHHKKHILGFNANVLYGPQNDQVEYPFYKNLWSYDASNSFINFYYTKSNTNKRWFFKINLRSNFIYSDFNYAYLEFEPKKNFQSKKLLLKTRGYIRLGTGTTPVESALFAAGANSETLFEQRITAANGLIPSNWTNFNNQTGVFHQNGGLNLRGYAGQLITQTSSGQALFIGKSGASANFELYFQELLGIKKHTFGKTLQLKSYVFNDYGIIYTKSVEDIDDINPLLIDAGLGLSMTVNSPYYKFKKFTISAEFPLILNNPIPGNNKIDFQYLIGLKTDI